MHKLLLKLTVAAAAAGSAPGSLCAQDDGGGDWNHFGAGARLTFNIRAKFQNIGAVGAPPPPGAGGATNRSYANGFVNADSGAGQGGLTWNWGYQNASQIQGDTLVFNTTAVSGATATRRDDPTSGFEFHYVRDLGHESWGAWGVKAGFGYEGVHLRDASAHTADATLVSDAYPLNGIQPPSAPYSGGFNGPGALIGGTPTRTLTTAPGGATITGFRSMDADVYEFRLGPDARFKLGGRVTLEVGAGLAAGVVDGAFTFSEATATSLATTAAAGSLRKTGALLGAYGEVVADCRVWRYASVFAGVQFQRLGHFNEATSGRGAQLDLNQTLSGVAGLRWSF